MDEEVELAAERLPDLTEDARHVLVGADVALGHERRVDRGGQLAHGRLDPFSLVRERETGAARGELSGDRPRDGALVGDTEDEPSLSCERSGHGGDPRGVACSLWARSPSSRAPPRGSAPRSRACSPPAATSASCSRVARSAWKRWPRSSAARRSRATSPTG